MANYVLEIRKQFGTYQARVFEKGQKAPEYSGNASALNDMVAAVKADIEGAGVGPDDSVYFRNIAYENLENLENLMLIVRDAPY